MATGADESIDGELTHTPEEKLPDNGNALDTLIASIEEKTALCELVFQDLLAVQKIITEKGLCDATIQE